jgi:hypothetical protein
MHANKHTNHTLTLRRASSHSSKQRYKISKSGKVIAHPSRPKARGLRPAVALSLPRAHVQQFERVLNNYGPHRQHKTIATATLPRAKPDRKPKK